MREMTDTGNDCLTCIPAEWSHPRLKYYCKISNGADPKTEGNIPAYGSGKEVVKYCGEYKEGPAILLGRKGTLDNPRYVEGKFWNVDTAMDAYPINGINPRFLFFITTILDIQRYATSTAKPSMTQGDYYNMPIPVPSREEQDSIVAFIDSKCAAIDEAIERHKKIIEKLNLFLVETIANATLYGISKSGMKPSGVEWTSQIPESWEIKRGKYLFVETNERSADGKEELLTVSQYTGITPRSQKNVNMFEAESLVGYKICEVNDIPANTMWLWAGAIGVSSYRGLISPSYNVYRQIDDQYDNVYLDYLLRATPLVQHYKALSTGIRPSRLRLYPDQFLNIKYPIPPMKEQKAIAAFLDDKKSKIEEAISRQIAAIERLEEYRKSIIYYAVTGKIDCREASA